jgi:riboflavin biosynthesis pyrimidine reductase
VRTDVGQGRVIVICPGSAAERAVSSLGGIPADIVVVPDAVGAVPVAQAVDALRDRGLHRIVCEGGPNLAGQLLDAELVDEICLSTGPLLTSARLPVFDTKSERRLELSQLLVDDASGLYARWAVRRNAPGAQG